MIVIVGLGVIGGSFAMALKEAGYANVAGLDSNPQTLQKALDRGLVDRASTDPAKLLPEADLVLLAIYPGSVLPFLQKSARLLRPGTLLTDVTGVKEALLRKIEGLLPPGVDFVPGHPMAGREKMGIDYASSAVFKGANYILTPLPGNAPEHIEQIEKMVLRLGFARVTKISPREHDELIAYTSQLPHAMAVALVNSDVEDRETGRFTGDSYRTLTRIAKINAPLWSELFFENREHLLEAMDRFSAQFEAIRRCVDEGDLDALTELFERSTRRREALDK